MPQNRTLPRGAFQIAQVPSPASSPVSPVAVAPGTVGATSAGLGQTGTASPSPVPTKPPPVLVIATPTPAPTPTPLVLVPAQNITEEIGNLPGVRDLPQKALFLRGVEVFLIVGLYLLLRQVVRRVIAKTTMVLARREEDAGNPGRAVRLRTLSQIITSLTLYTLAFVFGVSLLSAFGINVTAIIGTAGVAGLAFGFGAQKLVKDVITGFFILLEDQYVVGDYVTIGTVTGVVEGLEMRITRIRDDDGKLYILSNGDIAQVCNMSRGPVMGFIEIGVGASADLGRAVEVLQTDLAKAAETAGLPEPPRVDGVSAVEAAKTTLRITFKAPPGHRPNQYALRLREAARAALMGAQIPLG